MPSWQHISYSVVVIGLTEKVQPGGGDSWLQKLLFEYTDKRILEYHTSIRI